MKYGIAIVLSCMSLIPLRSFAGGDLQTEICEELVTDAASAVESVMTIYKADYFATRIHRNWKSEDTLFVEADVRGGIPSEGQPVIRYTATLAIEGDKCRLKTLGRIPLKKQ
ncbi:MAG: hypothetical protein AB7P04_03805 [Bacteriovoracia bacterium]